jgi:N utilization substance protein B
VAQGGRQGARRLLLQALYQSQVGGQALDVLTGQFRESAEFAKIDQAYFLAMLPAVLGNTETLDQRIAECADRPVDQLDPVEHAALWIGLQELTTRDDIPAGVAINEAVKLTREFGAQDSYRYVNAILDAAARDTS